MSKHENKKLAAAVESLGELMDKFSDYIGKSIALLVEAAKVYDKAVTEYGDEAKRAFAAAFPSYQPKDWDCLARIARKELSPKVFTIVNTYLVKAISSLDYDTQVDVLGEVGKSGKPVPVLSRGSVIEKTVDMMNASEIRSAIDEKAGRVRTIDEQVNAAAAKLAAKQAQPMWEVADGVLAVYKPGMVRGADLIKLYNQLDSVVKAMRKGVR